MYGRLTVFFMSLCSVYYFLSSISVLHSTHLHLYPSTSFWTDSVTRFYTSLIFYFCTVKYGVLSLQCIFNSETVFFTFRNIIPFTLSISLFIMILSFTNSSICIMFAAMPQYYFLQILSSLSFIFYFC